jgi:hypothetical protein
MKHIDRVNYQTRIWKQALEPKPEIPDPVGHGWKISNDELSYDWMDGPPAPEAVLELLSCDCRRNCSGPSCPCVSNGLLCTDMCKLRDCQNQRNQEEIVEPESDDFSDDDDDCDFVNF